MNTLQEENILLDQQVKEKFGDNQIEEQADLSNFKQCMVGTNEGFLDGNKKYAIISPQTRMGFLKRVLSKQVTIKEAAVEFGLKFSTSKAILQTFRREGRVEKKSFRSRKSKDGESNMVAEKKEISVEAPKPQLPLQNVDFNVTKTLDNGRSARQLDSVLEQMLIFQMAAQNQVDFHHMLAILNDFLKRQCLGHQLLMVQYTNEIQKYKMSNQMLREQLVQEKEGLSKPSGVNATFKKYRVDDSMKTNIPIQSALPSNLIKIPSFSLNNNGQTEINL